MVKIQNNNDVIAIVQARFGSSRFPGKILKKIEGVTILEILIKRLLQSKKIKKIIIACSTNPKDNRIIKICKQVGVLYYRGSEKNVLERYYFTAKKFKATNIARITSDCPLIDIDIVDQLIDRYQQNNYDYVSNCSPPTFPDGLDIEVFKFNLLEEAYTKVKSSYQKEHVTPYIKNIAKKKYNLQNKIDLSWMRLTLDEEKDFILIKKIYLKFKRKKIFYLKDILKLYKKDKKIFEINKHLKRNEGSDMISGQKMWRRAKSIIPGGSMLFSKNPDLFLPGKWPAYFKKSSGCSIWDLDNNKYTDLSFMGVGTNTLGYNHPKIDNEVIKNLKLGNMTTLNSTEEIKLAEKLVEIHPWAEMVRFTRSGGEANSVAVRIARAATGKNNIAICGYHGWHDWYLASNLQNFKNLDNHLMQNTPYLGIPESLKHTCYPFKYNNFSQLKELVREKNIGIIKMEVERNEKPSNNFLHKIRNLCDKKNIILIFDECTSGFRSTFGGLHKKYNVEPDIAIFGKALGNGYAINAIIGKKFVMEAVKNTFISSTFWTERIGPTAALATLNVMENLQSWKIISSIGEKIKNNWRQISKSNKVSISIQGINALPNFKFLNNNLEYKTLITQEMLKKRILAGNAIYCSIAHNDKILDNYFDLLNEIFIKISKVENESESLQNYLKSDVCISGMREKK